MASPTYFAASSADVSVPGPLVILKPAGVVEGDYMLALVANESVAIPAPAGWTLLLDGGVNRGRVFAKRAGASEPSSYSFTISTTNQSGAILAFRGAAESPVNVSDFTGEASGGSPGSPHPILCPSVTPTQGGLLVALVASMNEHTHTYPAGMTERIERSISANTVSAATQEISPGATGTRSVTLSDRNLNGAAGFSIVLAGAGGLRMWT